MIDNIITNTLLPALSREFLKRSLARGRRYTRPKCPRRMARSSTR